MQEQRKGISSSWIYLGIILLLIGGGIYLMLTKNMSEEENVELSNQVEQVSNDKNDLEHEYNAALLRLDELKTKGQQMENILSQKNTEVESLKNQIKSILGKQNASNTELMQANKLIAELNAKLNNYAQQNQQIQTENQQLATENKTIGQQKEKYDQEVATLDEEKKSLENKIEKGSVLTASGFEIIAINNKKKFLLVGKNVKKETEKAKKADVIKIKFDIDANRIAESGNKIIHICVFKPDGSLAIIDGDNNQSFKLAAGGEKQYSTIQNLNYKSGERIQDISIEWTPVSPIAKGNYTVEVYNMGYKIGGSVVILK